jgi:hypothetical protein
MMFKRTLICDGALETIVKWEGCGLDFAARSREHFVKQRFAGLGIRPRAVLKFGIPTIHSGWVLLLPGTGFGLSIRAGLPNTFLISV